MITSIVRKTKWGKQQKMLDLLRDAINFACDRGLSVSVGGEDSSRADPSFLLDVAYYAQELGAFRFRFCDTVGILDPLNTYSKVRSLVHQIIALLAQYPLPMDQYLNFLDMVLPDLFRWFLQAKHHC